MNTTTAYHNLTAAHDALLKTLTERAVNAVPAERIYLLGLTASHHQTGSVFTPLSDSWAEVTHCFLLVLVAKEGTEKLSQLQDIIEAACLPVVATTTIVLYTEQFYDWLWDKHPFAHTVQKLGIQLYSTVSNKQEGHLFTLDMEALKKAQESSYAKGMNKVQEFLAGAELYTVRKQYKLAAFMLHQAAEHNLVTLLKVTAGLRVNTHNLDRLIRYGSMLSYHLPHIFPRNKDNEKRLFRLLQNAYIGSRYKEDYSIHFGEVELLTRQVNLLKEEVVKQCKETFTR